MAKSKPTQSGGGFDPRNPVGKIQTVHAAVDNIQAATQTAVAPSEPTPSAVPTPPEIDSSPVQQTDSFDWQAYYEAQNNARRSSAFDEMYATLRDYGIDVDGSGLAAQLKNWVYADKSAASIMLELRKTDAYNKRFTGMADLIKRGQAISEAEYISQERSYGNVLRGWGLPTGFYDDPTDFGRFIANGVSVKELDDRVRSAQTFLDSTDPYYRQAITDEFGVDQSGLLALVLDGDKAQSVMSRQFKEAAYSGAANRSGFNLTADQSALYGATLGQQYDAIGTDQTNALNAQLSAYGNQALNQEKLSQIDQETGFARTDILDAQVLNDNTKKLKSQQRAQREQARFSGTSAITTGSLARNRSA